MAEDELRRSEPGGDQFLQTQRGRRLAADEFRHEGHARLFDPVTDQLRLFRREPA